MNTLEKPIEQNNLFWTLLGPINLLCSMGMLVLIHPGQLDHVWGLTFGISVILGLIITILSLGYSKNEINQFIKSKNIELQVQKSFYDQKLEEKEEKQAAFFQNQLKDTAEIEQLKNLIHSKESSYKQREEALLQNQLKDKAEIEQLKNLIHSNEISCQRRVETLLHNQLKDKAENEELKNLLHSKESTYKQSEEALLQNQLKDKAEIEQLKNLIHSNEISCQRRVETLLHNQLKDKAEIEQLTNLIQHNEIEYRKSLEEIEQKNKALCGVDNRALWQAKRKAEGLYEQLREQFEDKCSCLEETRRELFHTNETLLRMQNEEIERELYDDCDDKNRLIQHIIRMEKDYQSKISKLEHENDQYSQIIKTAL